MTALVLAVVALILALTGFLWLLFADPATEPEPPDWVNDHSRGTSR